MGLKYGRSHPVFLPTGFIKRDTSCENGVNIKIRVRFHPNHRKSRKNHMNCHAGSFLFVPCQKRNRIAGRYCLRFIPKSIIFLRQNLNLTALIREGSRFPFLTVHIDRKIKGQRILILCQKFSFKTELHRSPVQCFGKCLLKLMRLPYFSRQRTAFQHIRNCTLPGFICEKKEGANE